MSNKNIFRIFIFVQTIFLLLFGYSFFVYLKDGQHFLLTETQKLLDSPEKRLEGKLLFYEGFNDDHSLPVQSLVLEKKPDPTGATTDNAFLCLNGIDESYEITNPYIENFTSEFAVNFWIKPSLDKETGLQMILNDRGAHTFEIFYDTPTQRIVAKVVEDNLTKRAVLTQIEPDEWTNIIFVYDKEEMRIYKNGSLEEATKFQNKIRRPSRQIYIGKKSDLRPLYFRGCLDEIALFNCAISDKMISEISSQNPLPESILEACAIVESPKK